MSATYTDVWVCSDCMLAENGYDDHLNEDGTVTATGLEPFGLWRQNHRLTDNTCSNHDVEDTYDEDSYRDGGTTTCPHCGQDGHESGIDEFSWRQCSGCGSTLGGSRYRYAAHSD